MAAEDETTGHDSGDDTAASAADGGPVRRDGAAGHGVADIATGGTVVRRLPRARAAVWAEWNEPARFAEWFGGDAVEVPGGALRWHPVAGEAWSAETVLPDGERLLWSGEFLEVIDPVRLEFTMTDVTDAAAPGRIAVELGEAVDGGTELVLSVTGLASADERQAAVQAWSRYLDVLERRLTER